MASVELITKKDFKELMVQLTEVKILLKATFSEQQDKSYTHKEAAVYLGISIQTLYNLVNQGRVLKVDNNHKKNTYTFRELNKYKYNMPNEELERLLARESPLKSILKNQ